MRTHSVVAILALFTAACGGAPFETGSPSDEAGPSETLHDPPGPEAGLSPDAPTGAEAAAEAAADTGTAPETGDAGVGDAGSHADADPPETGSTETGSPETGSACSPSCVGGEVCSNGACCAEGATYCGSACVNTEADPMHCGSCGVACPAGDVCTNGSCGIDVGPNQCNQPKAVSGGFGTITGQPAGLSGCIVSSDSPSPFTAFTVGTDISLCSGETGEYPCCLLATDGVSCTCFSCAP